MWAALALVALLMTLKYFPGLENAAAYAGNVFQAIHPGAFPKDPYIGPERSIWEKSLQLSLIYVLPRFMGEVWLDDRFVAFVYLGLVLASVAGIDRIARVLGVEDLPARLAIQLMFMRDHHSLTVTATFAHQPDVNHAAFAIPLNIWLIYAALARKGLPVVVILSALLAAVSVKNAPYTIAYCLIVAALNGGRRDRIAVGIIFAAAFAAFATVVARVVPVPVEERGAVFDLIYQYGEKFVDANPFYPAPDATTAALRNAGFLALGVAAMLLPNPAGPAAKSARVFVGLGLAVWLLGGLYFSFAPDALKLPHVLPFSLTRNLIWPQTVAYLAIMAALFHWLRDRESWERAVTVAVAFAALLALGRANQHLWAGLLAASLLALTAWHAVRFGRPAVAGTQAPILGALARNGPLVLAQALALTVGIAFSIRIADRLPAWRTWAATGVMGDSGAAPWIGVAEYLRRNTPADAAVLPFEYEPRFPDRLQTTRNLGTRAGRTMPLLFLYSNLFNLEGWRAEQQHFDLVQRMERAFQERQWELGARLAGDLMPPPQYVILPDRLLPAPGESIPGLREQARINGFGILRMAD
jgi:hypothetical protein